MFSSKDTKVTYLKDYKERKTNKSRSNYKNKTEAEECKEEELKKIAITIDRIFK
ncbi:MAG: hypothetical protein GX981_00965 [Tissierellia bacterium]|nr:hypothetical protein [Tissierellia bacterium]